MQEKEVDHFLTEIKKIREWTYKAEQVCKEVAKYSLPIVSPMKDLAIPSTVLNEALNQAFFHDDY